MFDREKYLSIGQTRKRGPKKTPVRNGVQVEHADGRVDAYIKAKPVVGLGNIRKG